MELPDAITRVPWGIPEQNTKAPNGEPAPWRTLPRGGMHQKLGRWIQPKSCSIGLYNPLKPPSMRSFCAIEGTSGRAALHTHTPYP